MEKKIEKEIINIGKLIKKIKNKIDYKINRYIHELIIFKFFDKKNIFESIWRRNYWGDKNSVSGPGSTLEQTLNIREKLPKIFNDLKIKKIFDAPCGDMHWMNKLLTDVEISYIGGDIVDELIKKNNENLANENIKFIKFDITNNNFPDADIWLCRATLYHFSNIDIYLTLEKFIESNIPYMLTTNCITDSNHVNRDILTGDWRSLNLYLPPFNFCKDPILEIQDCVTPHPPMSLTLWSKEQIIDSMVNLREIYKN